MITVYAEPRHSRRVTVPPESTPASKRLAALIDRRQTLLDRIDRDLSRNA